MKNESQADADRWRKFEAWDNDQLWTAPPDFGDALRWMSDAWNLALRHDPLWPSRDAEDNWRHHAAVQRALSRPRHAA